MLPPNQIDGSGEVGGMPSTLRRLLIHFSMKRWPFIGNGIRNISNMFVSLKKKWEERARESSFQRRRKSWRRNWPDRWQKVTAKSQSFYQKKQRKSGAQVSTIGSAPAPAPAATETNENSEKRLPFRSSRQI